MFNFIKDNPFIFLLIFLAVVAPSLFKGVLGVILCVIVVVLILILILGIVFKVKIDRLRKEMEQQMGDPRRREDDPRRRDDDDVEIYREQAEKKKISDDVGEYVDFEEIEEK